MARGERLCRSRRSPDRPRLQTLSLGVDVSGRFWRKAATGANPLDRTAVEGDTFQQGRAGFVVGNVPRPSPFTAGLFRRRAERSKPWRFLRAQAAFVP